MNQVVLLEEMRFQDNRIFFDFTESKRVKAFSKFRSHEFEVIKRAFPVEIFFGKRIDMGKSKVEFVLVGQAKSPEIRFFGNDVSEFNMIVFQAGLLTGSHRIAIKNPRPLAA